MRPGEAPAGAAPLREKRKTRRSGPFGRLVRSPGAWGTLRSATTIAQTTGCSGTRLKVRTTVERVVPHQGRLATIRPVIWRPATSSSAGEPAGSRLAPRKEEQKNGSRNSNGHPPACADRYRAIVAVGGAAATGVGSQPEAVKTAGGSGLTPEPPATSVEAGVLMIAPNSTLRRFPLNVDLSRGSR